MRDSLIFIAFLLFAAPLSAQERTTHVYDVRGLGFVLGRLQIATELAPTTYETRTSFQTRGAARAVARVHFDMAATGRRRALRFATRHYAEDVNTGRRRSSTQLYYNQTEIRIAGGRLGSDAPPAPPEQQGDTTDPATAFILAAGPMPARTLCNLQQPIFDGARRTRLTLLPPEPTTDGGWQCRGEFRRIAGYTKRQLRQAETFSLLLTYEPRPAGLAQLVSARVDTVFGPVTLQLRRER